MKRSLDVIMTLYLFVDTNLFLQCRPLEQLDWSPMGQVDAIELVLSRPVQAELDALKGKGNGRQASRARAASTQIRKLLESADNRLSLREASPAVHLWLNPSLRPINEPSGVLDYDHRDDQLVGIALGYLVANSGAQVALLTNDTGPMASAKAVGLPYMGMPDGWLLPAELDEAAKREARLKDELDLYKKQEPAFTIEFGAGEGGRFAVEVNRYVPLTDEETQAFVARLHAEHPLSEEFGETEIREREAPDQGPFALFASAKEVFTPTTPAEIQRYRKAHGEWVEACENELKSLSKALQRREVLPRVSVSVLNAGARPADDALVTVDADGRFLLSPRKRKTDDDEPEEPKANRGLALPRPPTAPKGRWVKQHVSSIGEAIARMAALDDLTINVPKTLSVTPFRGAARDPNGIYFKVGARGDPRSHIEYECAQWRHAQVAHDFEFSVWFPVEPGLYAGVIKVAVHAANLTQPARGQLPISITVHAASCVDTATAMIDALSSPPAEILLVGKPVKPPSP
ncbi:MAG: hypothetical protein E6Q67_01740 [Roseateles sp.]|nr:MAG: hypothetical protein E6Q67_01740 [Roseateles sp.]